MKRLAFKGSSFAPAAAVVILTLGSGTQLCAQYSPQPPPQQMPQQGFPQQGVPQQGQQQGPYAGQYGQPLPTAAEAPARMSPDQLENLVAPIALYPDELLGQILAASTYPLEIVDAEQWLQQNRNLPANQRVEAAKQQNWDPSVQALAAFPDVLDILGRDVRWTTDLGNAFLGQQADVMNAIQSMRARAQQSGKLQSTQQQVVSTQVQDGQSAIQIAPADPQYIYPPQYDPYAVWGPPAYGAYPSLHYPPAWGPFGAGIGFGVGTFLGGLFSGLLGFGGWGWGLSWLGHALFFNPLFFGHYGFHGYGGYGGGYGYHGALVGGHPVWSHDPGHRLSVPYGSREVASRFGGRFSGGGTSMAARSVGASGLSRSSVGAQAGGGAWRGVGSGGSSAARSPSAGGNQFAGNRFNGGSAGQSFGQANRSVGSGSFNRVGPSQTGSSQGHRGSMGQSFAASPRGQTEGRAQPQARQSQSQARPSQSEARSFSAPRAQSAPRSSGGSAPHASSGGGSSHASASHGGGGGGGHSSGGGHSGGHHG